MSSGKSEVNMKRNVDFQGLWVVKLRLSVLLVTLSLKKQVTLEKLGISSQSEAQQIATSSLRYSSAGLHRLLGHGNGGISHLLHYKL